MAKSAAVPRRRTVRRYSLRSWDPNAIIAGIEMVKLLARQCPDDARWAFTSSMCQRDDGQALAEILADVEEDLTGKTRERLVEGLRVALDLKRPQQPIQRSKRVSPPRPR